MHSVDRCLAIWRRTIDASIALGERLDDRDWALRTGPDDWSIRDVYAHLAAAELWLAVDAVQSDRGVTGWPLAAVRAAHRPGSVGPRAPGPPAQVLAELREAHRYRLGAPLPAPDRPARTASGAATSYGRLLVLHAIDAWAHLQAVRRALGADEVTDAADVRDLLLDELVAAVDVEPGRYLRITVIGDIAVDVTVGVDGVGPVLAPTAAATASAVLSWEDIAALACRPTAAQLRTVSVGGARELAHAMLRRVFPLQRGYVYSQNVTFQHTYCGYVGAMPHHTVRAKLGIVSTYLPRRCGLATYTADLRQALAMATDDLEPVVVAIDRDGHQYGDEVVATIRQDRLSDYGTVADKLQAVGVGAVLIQHEYGIFGGSNGAHVLTLARALRERGIPYLVTLHTVLSRPSPGQLATLRALCVHAARVTVFTETARKMAIRTGIAAGHQIVVVPHGAPMALQAPPEVDTLGPELAELIERLHRRPTLTTFGLLSPGKGIDLAITALERVVQRHPDTQYVVAGATHPEVVRHAGEAYRQSLHEQVDRLGLSGQVHFVDAFLAEQELSALLHQTTLFVTPYRSPEQICSGALTFALAAGRPVVSTAYQYAEDMLRYGAGRIVPCGDADGLGTAITELLDDPDALHDATSAARSIGARITWPAVAVREAALVREVLAEATAARASAGPGVPHTVGVAPPLRLEHLDRLTDEIGIIQFARGAEPALDSGYCVDDVARLAIVAADLLGIGRAGDLATRWVRQSVHFLAAAYQPGETGMRNLLSYTGTWLDQPHVGDHVGRAMWGLGVVASSPACPPDARRAADALLADLVGTVDAVADTGLRAGAYALLGMARAGRPAAELAPLVRRLSDALTETSGQAPDWYWFEPELTYDNARLAQAMLAGAVRLRDGESASHAIDALDWYVGHVGLPTGTLRSVGNLWHRRDDDDPGAAWAVDGDEQPIDPASCAEALTEAWRYTRDPRYARLAAWAHAWFLGRNRAGVRLYVDATGGCHDGLSATAANPNQGAESTLAYYQALLALVGSGLVTLPGAEAERTPTAKRPAAPNRPPSTGVAGPGMTPPGLTSTGLAAAATTAGEATTPTRPATTKTPKITKRPDRPTINRIRKTEGPTDAH